jgi:hypothetical protein
MRHSPRRRLGARRPVPTLVALVVLVAASLVTLNLTSPGVAQASDDWTSGHGGPRSLDCTGTQPNLRSAYSKYSGGPVAGSPGAYIETLVCYGADPVVGYDVSVQGYADDIATDGYCARNRIRYKVYITGWSDWQYRWLATACQGGLDPYGSTWWWSRLPITSLQTQACVSEGRDGATLGWSCSAWQ